MESHRTGFPPLPLLLEIPSGLPHSHRFDNGIDISERIRCSAELGRATFYIVG